MTLEKRSLSAQNSRFPILQIPKLYRNRYEGSQFVSVLLFSNEAYHLIAGPLQSKWIFIVLQLRPYYMVCHLSLIWLIYVLIFPIHLFTPLQLIKSVLYHLWKICLLASTTRLTQAESPTRLNRNWLWSFFPLFSIMSGHPGQVLGGQIVCFWR